MAQLQGRSYDSSDLKELMDNTGGWAKNWDDVLWFIKHVAVYDADFATDEIPDLAHDVETLHDEHKPFTTDYREMYQEITGKPCRGCPSPEGVQSHGLHPRQIADNWLQGLQFPASKQDAIRRAEDNESPPNLLAVLRKIADKRYSSMGNLLEGIGDVTWDHD